MPPLASAPADGPPRPGFTEFVVLVAFMMAVPAFGIDGVLPALPVIGRTFGMTDPNRLQLVVTAYMTGFAVTHLVYGPASDIVGRRRAFLAGMLLCAVGSALAVAANDFTLLLAARFVQGAGAAAGRVIGMAIVRDCYSGREMARVMSLTTVVFVTVPIFAPAVGSLLLLLGGWHAILWAMIAVVMLVSLWLWRRMPETLHPEFRLPASVGPILAGIRLTVTTRATLGYASAFGLMFGCIMSYVGSAEQVFGSGVYGLGPLFPLAFGAVAFMMGVAGFVNSALVRRHGMHRLSHAAILGLVILAILQVAAALAFGGRPPLLVFGAILGLSQFATSLAMANFNALAMEPLGSVAGTASSFVGFYTTLLGAACGLAVGQAYDGTVVPLAIGYLVLSSLAVVAVLVTERGRLFRPTHRDPA